MEELITKLEECTSQYLAGRQQRAKLRTRYDGLREEESRLREEANRLAEEAKGLQKELGLGSKSRRSLERERGRLVEALLGELVDSAGKLAVYDDKEREAFERYKKLLGGALGEDVLASDKEVILTYEKTSNAIIKGSLEKAYQEAKAREDRRGELERLRKKVGENWEMYERPPTAGIVVRPQGEKSLEVYVSVPEEESKQREGLPRYLTGTVMDAIVRRGQEIREAGGTVEEVVRKAEGWRGILKLELALDSSERLIEILRELEPAEFKERSIGYRVMGVASLKEEGQEEERTGDSGLERELALWREHAPEGYVHIRDTSRYVRGGDWVYRRLKGKGGTIESQKVRVPGLLKRQTYVEIKSLEEAVAADRKRSKREEGRSEERPELLTGRKERQILEEVPEGYISSRKAAERLGMPKGTAYRRYDVEGGPIKSVLVRKEGAGQAYRFVEERSLEDYLRGDYLGRQGEGQEREEGIERRVVEQREEKGLEAPEGYLHIKEAAERAGLDSTTLYKKLKGRKSTEGREGEALIEWKKVGKYTFVELVSFEAWLAGRRKK